MDTEAEGLQWHAVINQCCGANGALAPVLTTRKGQTLAMVLSNTIRPSACVRQVQEDCCKASHLLGSEVTYGALTSTPVRYGPAATPPAPPGAFPTLCSEGAGVGMGLGYAKAGASQGLLFPASVHALPGQASLHEVARSWASSPSP